MVDKSEKFSLLVRLGYLARAVLYTLIGLIALQSRDEVREGAQGVFRAVEDFPAGTIILWLLAIGLFGYSLFRFASAFFDIENHGSDKRGIARRIGHGASGIGHLALAWSAYNFATGTGSSSDGAQEAASGILSFELGGIVLGLIGIGFLIAAFEQGKKGLTGSFMQRISGQAPSGTRTLGGIGYVARGVVFLVIGWSLMRSAWFDSSSQVKTLGDAIADLGDMGFVYTLVAIGLLVFGLFSFVLARYRIIPDLGAQGIRPAYR